MAGVVDMVLCSETQHSCVDSHCCLALGEREEADLVFVVLLSLFDFGCAFHHWVLSLAVDPSSRTGKIGTKDVKCSSRARSILQWHHETGSVTSKLTVDHESAA